MNFIHHIGIKRCHHHVLLVPVNEAKPVKNTGVEPGHRMTYPYLLTQFL